MAQITLELSTVEAHLLLRATNRERLEASEAAAKAKNETVREYEDVTSKILARVEAQMCDLMFPEPTTATAP